MIAQTRSLLVYKLLVNLLLLSLVLVGCSSAQTPVAPTSTVPAQVTLTMSGASTALAILTALQDTFEAANPGYRLQILEGSGNDAAFTGLEDGTLDAGAFTRLDAEEAQARNVSGIEFGRSAIAPFVHSDVGVANLTGEQLAEIYAGRISNWSELGGPDLPIVVYIREEDESVTEKLREAYFGDTSFTSTAQLATSTTNIVSAVAGTPGSIGYGGWPGAVAVGAAVEPIAIDGVAPVDAAYPVTNQLIIGYHNERQADVQPLIDWLLSERGQEELFNLGVIPVVQS